LPSLEGLEHRALPASFTPVYSALFGDAVTADNAFTAADGKRYWTVDPGADQYQTDLYERPTAQTYQVRRLADGTEQFAAREYFQNLDIVQAQAGFDADYLYVSVKLAGLNKLTDDGKTTAEGLVYRYGFRIAKQTDGGGGLLIVADQPQLKNAPHTAFGPKGTFVYRDANGDVGGTGLDVTKQDRQAEVGGNGYERVLAADGRLVSGRQVLWVRVDPSDPSVVEFVLDYKAVGYTADDLATLPYFTAEANKGLQSPANYLWNDEYTKSEAGSPYRATHGDRSKSEFGTQGLGNIYELDTVYLGPLAPLAGSSIAGSVYADLNANGVRDVDEPGIAGVTITLTGTDDLGNAVTRTVVTDLEGQYRFGDLRAGTYQLFETQPGEYEDGAETIGTVNGAPRGQLEDNDLIGEIVLGVGEEAIGYDFGEVQAFAPS
jgi:hypothetical protein